jgi:hypothetical protein
MAIRCRPARREIEDHGSPQPCLAQFARTAPALAGLIEQPGERNEQLNAIFTPTADGFISFDARRRVRYVNLASPA